MSTLLQLHTIVRVLLAVSAAIPSAVADIGLAQVMQQLRERRAALDRIEIDFDWRRCQASRKDDPYAPQNWRKEGNHLFSCQMRLLYPHFQLDRRDVGERTSEAGIHAWIDGKLTSIHPQSDGRDGVLVYPQTFNVYKGMPLLTPMEMQVFDIQHSLVEIIEAGGFSARTSDDGLIVIDGLCALRPYHEWQVTARLDPQRGLLPVELVAVLPIKNNTQKITWTQRTLASQPIGPVHAITEAITALFNEAVEMPEPVWQVYHCKVRRIERVPNLTKADLALQLPTRNFVLIDNVQGILREVDAQGATVYEEHRTAEDIRLIEEAKLNAMHGAEELTRTAQARARAFRYVLGGSVTLAVLVTGLLIWRRWSLTRHSHPAV